jgi:hypothetical protein
MSEPNKKDAPSRRAPKVPPVEAPPKPLTAEWESAVKALGAASFANFHEAVEGLVDVVLSRAGRGVDRETTKEFLENLLLTDPEIEAELRALLTVRDS